MDNNITAMTGHQANPGTGYNAIGEKVDRVNIEEVISSYGIKDVKVVSAWNQKQLQDAIRKFSNKKEVSVIVVKGICRLLMKRILRKQGKIFPKFEIDQNKCTKCGICTQEFACPAIQREKRDGEWHYFINEDLCWGCGVCAQICPSNAIRVKREK